MAFLLPAAFALGLLAVPIILLSLLRRRPPQRAISSTIPWRRLLEGAPQQARRRRARPSLLLLLQLAALAALIVAAARPVTTQARMVSGDLIVIVDRSYAMQARDIHPSRFAAAIQRAESLVGSLAPNHVATVIGMGAQPHVAIADSSSVSTVHHVLAEMRPGIGSPNFPAALSLALSFARNAAGTRIVVLTSRASGITGLPLATTIPVEIDRLGGAMHDLQITSFSADAASPYTDAYLHLRNVSPEPSSTTIDLEADGTLIDVRPVTIPAGRDDTEVWQHLPSGIHTLRATLTTPDDMAIDKSVTAALSPTRRHILLVGGGDYFLQEALSLTPGAYVTHIALRHYSPARASDADLVVFDGVLPIALPPAPSLLVAPPAGHAGHFRFSRQVAVNGAFHASSPALFRYVDLADVHIPLARVATLPHGFRPALSEGRQTLIAASLHGAVPTAVLLFNPQLSDWPLSAGFPLLIQNLVATLDPGLTSGVTSLSLGSAITFHPRPGTSHLTVDVPGGRAIGLNAPFASYAPPDPGLYRVRAESSDALFAVNLVPPSLSSAAGPAILRFGHVTRAQSVATHATLDASWLFVAAGLALLTFEWIVGANR